MLSDESIRREGRGSLPRRLLIRARSACAGPGRARRNGQMQKLLGDAQFTIFSNNCLGGVFYHDAGREFLSPLINTAMDGEDFLRFLERPQHYLAQEMRFISWPGYDYPIARLDDIEIRFVHYATPEEAEKKFRERAQRILWDKVFIIATNHDGLGKPECMARFDRLPYRNKIMFVSGDYPQYDWALCVPQFRGRFQLRVMTNYANFRGERYYETAFDLARWISENM